MHNGSNYDYHFIIKVLAEAFKNNSLEKILKKIYKLYSSNKKKKLQESIKIEKRLQKNISYVLPFIDSTRFMTSSLSNLVNNLFEGVHRIKYKHGHDDKKYETCKN